MVENSSVFGSSKLTFLSSSNPLVRLIAPQARLFSCLLESSGPVLVFSTYDSCGPNTSTFPSSTSHRSFDVSVQELHLVLLAVPNKFQSRVSFHTNQTTACCRLPDRLLRQLLDHACTPSPVTLRSLTLQSSCTLPTHCTTLLTPSASAASNISVNSLFIPVLPLVFSSR